MGLGLVLLVGTLVASPAWAELKIGVVDYGKLVEDRRRPRWP